MPQQANVSETNYDKIKMAHYHPVWYTMRKQCLNVNENGILQPTRCDCIYGLKTEDALEHRNTIKEVISVDSPFRVQYGHEKVW
jgi:hypothetical protein